MVDPVESLKALLWELPAEFSYADPHTLNEHEFRNQFSVIKRSNVRKVHEALWALQEHFGLTDS